MKYDALIFDLFGTLVDTFPPAEYERLLAELAAILQAPTEAFNHMWSVEMWPMRALGQLASLEETFSYACHALAVPITEAQLQRAVQMRLDYSNNSLLPRPDALETLTALKARGYKLGLISDCTLEVPRLWQASPLAALIDGPIFSCEVKLKKPDPQIYQLAYEQLGVVPQRCLYVGDGGSQELTGATAVGMDALLIRVPYEESLHHSQYRRGGETWAGTKVTSLSEILHRVE